MQPGTGPATSSTGTIDSSAPSQTGSAINLSETDVDKALQRAASEALGEREGTIIVMDPQNGRLRAVVNPRLAFEQAFPPGSAIKPFTALTALQVGLIDGESRMPCREHYTHGHFLISCSHPKSKMAFDLPHALAYSCNFYFATLSERLSQGSFAKTLTSFGFGARTGVNGANESSGELPKGEWRLEAGLGESRQLLVTPIQLLVAYSALFNGGHRYRPQQAGPTRFLPHELVRLSISPVHQAILAEGMRGAIRYGTAAKAHLALLPPYLFGKTGTSTASNAFRTQGWFVGLAADQNEMVQSSPNTINLAVLVFLKKSHGAQCAEMAQPIFLEYAKSLQRAVTWQHPGLQRSNLETRELEKDPMPRAAPAIRLHCRRENTIRTLSLEQYLPGVLAAEASVEDQLEALKAQAVISRTFALKNHGRHETEGYDFCSTTHCQRFEVEEANEQSRSKKARLRAIAETAGEVLTDEKGQWVDAYFHAACGGMTADIGTLWGMKPPSYLLGVRDDFCATMPHRRWTQTIPLASLARALHSDPRSDVGPQLNNVSVVRHDATGRAEVIALEGDRRRLIGGWDFKLIVGRSLGWSILKSSRFEVTRYAEGFRFFGSGFGHGLGLCQEGAHVMARRGTSYRQILNFYFPNVRLGSDSAVDNAAPHTTQAEATRISGDGRLLGPSQSTSLTISSEHFRVAYPTGTELSEIEGVLNILELARNDLLNRLALASLTLSEPSQLKVVIHQTTGNFMEATGQPWWIAAATRGWQIQLQPLRVLRRLGRLTTTLRHEYTHAVIEVLSRGRAARWLVEGLAVHVAGEGDIFSPSPRVTELPLSELEHRLASPASREDMRALYAAAYQRVRTLISADSEANVWRRITGS